jgi:antirestriction protein ArdC
MLAPYSDGAFVTFNQAQSLGGSVKKGEKGWPVVFWKFPTADEVAAGKRHQGCQQGSEDDFGRG